MDHLASSFLGLGNGGTYAALTLALVLTYRASGVINFATGAQALYAAYTYAFLRAGKLLVIIPGLPTTVDLGSPVPMVPALGITLLISAVFGALLYLVVFRPLRNAPPLARAVASLGVLVVMQSLMSNKLSTSPVSVAAIFPRARWRWQDMTLLSDRFYLALTVVVVTLLITAAYRWTALRAAHPRHGRVPEGAYVTGISPNRIALLNWTISGAVAGLAGILIAPPRRSPPRPTRCSSCPPSPPPSSAGSSPRSSR